MANEVRIVIKAVDQTKQAFQSAQTRGEKFRAFTGGVGKVAGGVLAANFVAGAGTKIVDFFGDVQAEAKEARVVAASTAQGIKTMGADSWTSAQQIAALADATSKKIGVDDELIQHSANLLLTFRNVKNVAGENNDIFNRSVVAAQDLAAKGFGSADSSAKMLGKALNDPIKGITALSRAGVTFTDKQKDQIKTMVESGDVLGAQKIIMKEVEAQVGGTAEATATGADKMKVGWENLKESLGTKLQPVLDKIFEKITKVIDWMSEHQGVVIAFAAIIGGVLVGAFAALAVSVIAATWPFLAVGAAVGVLAYLMVKHWNTIKNAVTSAKNWIGDRISDIAGFFRGLPGRIGNIGSRIWRSITSGARSAVNSVVGFINGIIGKINGLIDAINSIPGVPNIPHVPGVPYVGPSNPTAHSEHSFQHGGIASGLALVGERGRELVRLPHGSTVYSNADTERMLGAGGSSGVMHITLMIGDRTLSDLILDPLRKAVRVKGGNVQAVLGS